MAEHHEIGVFMRNRQTSHLATSKTKPFAFALLVMTLGGCSAGGGNNYGGTVAARGKAPTAASPTYSSGNVEEQGDDEKEASTPMSPSQPAQSPTKTPPAPVAVPVPSAIVDIPSNVTGAFLVCANDTINDKTVSVNCSAVTDLTSKKKLNLTFYTGVKWGATHSSSLTVSAAVPIVTPSYWHVSYKVSGTSKDDLKSKISQVSFSFNGTDENGVVHNGAKKVDPTAPRPDLTIQSRKLGNDGYRCIEDTAGDDKFNTSLCAPNAIHEFSITNAWKIASAAGKCISFNAVSKLTERADCDSADARVFTYDAANQQLKIGGMNNMCLSLLSYDAAWDKDMPGAETCNTGSALQKWAISPAIMP